MIGVAHADNNGLVASVFLALLAFAKDEPSYFEQNQAKSPKPNDFRV
jgi:hypothetical protein